MIVCFMEKIRAQHFKMQLEILSKNAFVLNSRFSEMILIILSDFLWFAIVGRFYLNLQSHVPHISTKLLHVLERMK